MKTMSEIGLLCRYCGHSLQIGETQDLMATVCSPCLRTGLYCGHCGAMDHGLNPLPDQEKGT